MEQAVFELRAANLYVLSKLELPLEAAAGDALMQVSRLFGLLDLTRRRSTRRHALRY